MALITTSPADKNPFRVALPGCYARVTRYEGDKATVRLHLSVWVSAESALMDGEPIASEEFVFEIPQRLDVNPVAWAYETLKASGQLGETKDA